MRFPAPPRFTRSIIGIGLLLIGLALAGCGIRLAPSYDRAIVDGLTRANEETMTLFASVAAGAPTNTFAAPELAYGALIGRFEALRLEAQVRPIPQTSIPVALVFGNNPQTQQRIAEAATAPTADICAATFTGTIRRAVMPLELY